MGILLAHARTARGAHAHVADHRCARHCATAARRPSRILHDQPCATHRSRGAKSFRIGVNRYLYNMREVAMKGRDLSDCRALCARLFLAWSLSEFHADAHEKVCPRISTLRRCLMCVVKLRRG